MDNIELSKKKINAEKEIKEIKEENKALEKADKQTGIVIEKGNAESGKIEDNFPVVKKENIKQIVSVRVGKMSRKELERLRGLYGDAEKKIHEENIAKAGYDKPMDHDQVALLQNSLHEKVMGFRDGKEAVVDFKWMAGVSRELRYDIEWLMEYYKLHNPNIVEFGVEQKEKLALGKYNISIKGAEKIYEYQGRGTNNCFCCSGAAMLNQYLRNKNKEADPQQRFTQHDIRSYVPRIKKYSQKYAQFMDKKDHDKYIREVDAFAGEGKTVVGNVFDIGDLFLEKLEDNSVMLNQVTFNMPVNRKAAEIEVIKHNIKATMMDKINEALSSGNVISLGECYVGGGHFTTITGIKGNTIEYMDSLNRTDANKIHTTTIDHFIDQMEKLGHTMEMIWLSDMKKPEELKAEYSNLEYSEQNGFSLKEEITENAAHPALTKGLVVGKRIADEGGDIEGVTQRVYIPNPKVQIETETIAEHEWVKEEEKEEVKEEKKEEVKEEKKEEVKEEKKEETKEEKKEETKEEKKEEAKEEKKEEAKEEKQEEVKEEKQEEVKDRFSKFISAKVEKDKKRNSVLKADEKTEGKTDKAQIKKEKKRIADYEKANKDYAKYGVGFELDKIQKTDADSRAMSDIKDALEPYLKFRSYLFKHYNLKDSTAQQVLDKDFYNVQRTDNLTLIEKEESIKRRMRGGLDSIDCDELAKLWERVHLCVNHYIFTRSRRFKWGRGKERLKQVKEIRRKLRIDNVRFKLSEGQRRVVDSAELLFLDYGGNGYIEKKNMLFPSWNIANSQRNQINLTNWAYREKRQKQREGSADYGPLPNMFVRMKEWTEVALLNDVRRLVMLYEGVGGLIDRGLGLATMLAANTLKLGGKIIKAPLKLLSMGFNYASKNWFHSNKRWRMQYSLTKGWKGLDHGRVLFRRYFKGALIPLAAVGETLFRGIPYIFGHSFKHGVYKHTRKWGGDIVKDVNGIFDRLWYNKKYRSLEAARAEVNNQPAGDDDDDEEFDETENIKKEDNKEAETGENNTSEENEDKDEDTAEEKTAEKKAQKEKTVEKKAQKEKAEEKKTEEEKTSAVKKTEDEKAAFDKQIKKRYEDYYNSLEDKKYHDTMGTVRSRKALAWVWMLRSEKKYTIDQCSELYNTLLINKYENDEAKGRKMAAVEKIFEAILEFDINRLQYNKLSDLLSDKYEDTANMIGAIWEIENKYLDQYESMIKDEKVKCALNIEQLKEVRARWDLIQTSMMHIRNIIVLRGLLKKHNIEIDKEFENSSDQLYAKVAGASKEKQEIYNALGMAKFMLELPDAYKGGDVLKLYEKMRTEKYKLGKESLIPEALKAIRERQTDDKKKQD